MHHQQRMVKPRPTFVTDISTPRAAVSTSEDSNLPSGGLDQLDRVNQSTISSFNARKPKRSFWKRARDWFRRRPVNILAEASASSNIVYATNTTSESSRSGASAELSSIEILDDGEAEHGRMKKLRNTRSSRGLSPTFPAIISPPLATVESLSDNSENRSDVVADQPAYASPSTKHQFWKKTKDSIIQVRRVGAVLEVRKSHAPIEYEVPDGGYGWVCVVCVFVMYGLVVGIYRSSGVIYIEVKQEYPNASHTTVALIPSVSVSLTVAFAMVAGGLSRKYSSRSIGIICGFATSLSLAAIYFTTSIEYLFVCYIFAGIFGAGATMPGVLVLAFYFRRHRSLATGFALTGTAVSGLFQPPLVEYLCDLYTFRGAMLVMGALTLHTLPCAMLLHNPWDPVVLRYKKKLKKDSQYEEGDEIAYVIPVGRSYASDISDLDNEESLDVVTLRSIPPSHSESGTPYVPGVREKKRRTSARGGVFEPVLNYMTLRRPSRSHVLWHSHTRVYRPHTHARGLEGRYSTIDLKRSRFSQWLYNATYIDLSFLINPVFVVVLLASVFSTGSYPHVVVFLPAHGVDAGGYDKDQATLLVTVCACGDILGRLFFGWFFDKKYVSLQHGLLVCIFIVAASLWLLVLSTNFVFMGICVFVYGIAGGPTVLLIPVLLSDHHGAASLGSSYGIVRFGQALICIVTPTLAGYFKDKTGNYIYSFLLFSFSAVLGAIVMAFMTPAKVYYKRMASRKAWIRALEGQRREAMACSPATLPSPARTQTRSSVDVLQKTRPSMLTTRTPSPSKSRTLRQAVVLDSRSDPALDEDT